MALMIIVIIKKCGLCGKKKFSPSLIDDDLYTCAKCLVAVAKRGLDEQREYFNSAVESMNSFRQYESDSNKRGGYNG